MSGLSAPTTVRRVGKYEVGRTLGEGTFAKVKYAINTENGESVAVKVLDKEKVLQNKMVDQIKREISIMKLVRHPNVVQLYEVLASRTKIYIVLEFVTGGELFDVIVHQGRIGEGESRRFFQQLVDAVEFCHSKGVFHRDLKPENLLLDDKGNLKISDFGLSALAHQVREDGLLHTTCGTPNYVAPEVLSDRGYDGALADIWSCGVILYVLLAGFLPFDEPDIVTLYRKIQRAQYRCPPWFSPGVIRLLSHVLDPNPKTRYRYDQIRQDPWFRVGYMPVRPFSEKDLSHLEDIDAVFSGSREHEIAEEKQAGGLRSPLREQRSCTEGKQLPGPPAFELGGQGGAGVRPETLNAFELISLSQGLDLGVLFERRRDMVRRRTRFASRAPPDDIILRVEAAARDLRFSVHSKHYMAKLESGPAAGPLAGLTVVIQVFEVTPAVRIVEVWKAAGNVLTFHKFYRNFYPQLMDLVWKSEADLDQMEQQQQQQQQQQQGLKRKVLLSSPSQRAHHHHHRHSHSLSTPRLPNIGS